MIHASWINEMIPVNDPIIERPVAKISDVERKIGAEVALLIEDGNLIDTCILISSLTTQNYRTIASNSLLIQPVYRSYPSNGNWGYSGCSIVLPYQS